MKLNEMDKVKEVDLLKDMLAWDSKKAFTFNNAAKGSHYNELLVVKDPDIRIESIVRVTALWAFYLLNNLEEVVQYLRCPTRKMFNKMVKPLLEGQLVPC